MPSFRDGASPPALLRLAVRKQASPRFGQHRPTLLGRVTRLSDKWQPAALLCQLPKFFLTRESCNRIVTHYASPFGYIFHRGKARSKNGGRLPRPGRSHPPRRARPAAAGKPARGTNRAGVSGVAAGHLQAPATAAPGAFGQRTAAGKTSLLPTQSRTPASSRFLAGAVSCILAREPGQLEGVCRSRARQRE